MIHWSTEYMHRTLMVAQRLRKRYREKLILWNYREEWYEKYVSSVELSGASLKKLEKIDIPEFQGIKKRMYQMKKAAYQETMMEVLDITKDSRYEKEGRSYGDNTKYRGYETDRTIMC